LAEPQPFPVPIEEELAARFPGLAVRALSFRARVLEAGYGFEQELQALRRGLNLDLTSLKEHPVVRAYRDFYWRLGIDPTKQRPSSESLVRRLLLRGGLPSINNVVDAGNLASAETLIAIGLYDLARVRGVPRLRWAREGELFVDITGREVVLTAKSVVLADELGVMHVYPFRDANRTKVTGSTNHVLALACGVPGIGPELLEGALRRVVELVRRLGG